MITGTVLLTSATSVLLIGPVDAPYEVLVAVPVGEGGVALGGASFTFSYGSPGDWFVLATPNYLTYPVPAEAKLRLQEGDSLYVSIVSGDATVTFIGNPAC